MIRVFLDTTTETDLHWDVSWPKTLKGPSNSVQRDLARLVADNRDQLLQEWEQKSCQP